MPASTISNTAPVSMSPSMSSTMISSCGIPGNNGISVINTQYNPYNNYPIFSNTNMSLTAATTNFNDVSVTNTLSIEGGDILLNGDSLSDRLARIESLLHIPTRDVKLEEKYADLRDLWNQYNTALENYINWERLKND